MQRDEIDWGKTDIPKLFRKIFIPTLMGMLTFASINLIDGAFVGQGVGSDALAAINIVGPFFLITTGIGLMFGTGASIVASIHLAKDKRKAARLNVTQAYAACLLIISSIIGISMIDLEVTARLLGSTGRLTPYVVDYMHWILPAMIPGALLCMGMFIIRLDGSPKYAMWCNIVPGVLNVGLDWLFIFPFQMGITGAAVATAIAETVGGLMILGYMLLLSRNVRLHPLKLSAKSFRLSLRNIGWQAKLGTSSMVGELAIACMMFVGNFVFIRHLGEDGVAAFSVACYCFPLVFMLGNAIAQSAQPIISYNHGAGLHDRVSQMIRFSLIAALASGILVSVIGIFHGNLIIALFIPDTTSAASVIANAGFPLYALAFLFFTLNIVCIGDLQSLERFKPATIFMLLRGVVFVVPAFLLLPELLGAPGLWLAVPLSECLTLTAIAASALFAKKQRK